MTAAWALLAAALLLAGGGFGRESRAADGSAAESPAADGSAADGSAEEGSVPSSSRGAAVAALAVAAACVAVLGAPAGLLVGLAAGPVVFVVLTRLARRPTAITPDRELALVLDLCAAALRAGFPLGDALAVAAPAGPRPLAQALTRVAGLLRLGARPGDAWAAVPVESPLTPVVPVAIRSAASGVRLADAFEGLAAELRAGSAAAAAARAQRAGVWAVAPLGACFLPSFVCLGIVPAVVGIASSALGGLP